MKNQENKRPFKKVKPVTVYVGNLIYSKSEGQIKRLFAKYGKVNFVNIVIDEKSQRSKGIAFVQMTNPVAAEEAILELNGRQVDGRKLKVSIAQEREKPKAPIAKTSKVQSKPESNESKPVRRPKKRNRSSGLDELFNYLEKK